MELKKYYLQDLHEGMNFQFEKFITEKDVNNFVALSGDISPVHVNDEFAKEVGFKGQVVHGALLVSYLSRLIGVHLPGENCFLHSYNLKFLSPTFINDTVRISGKIDQISESMNVIILKVMIENCNTNTVLVQGKIQVGLFKKK